MFIKFGDQNTDKLFDVIEMAGGQLRVVGGFVRDLVAGLKPKDIDFATDLSPEDVIYFMERAGLEVIPTGLKHGTVTVVVGNEGYEITTLRADVETDGRHAVVDFVQDFETDAARRDFTINALSADRAGRVYDYFGGLEDLAANRVRFVGSPQKRIQEDYLRILRYFRFSARFGSQDEFDPETHKAIEENAVGLDRVSVERIWKELSQILVLSNGERQLNIMQTLGVTAAIGFPWDARLSGLLSRVRQQLNDPAVLLGSICMNAEIADLLPLRWKLSTNATDRAVTAARIVSDRSVDDKYWRIRQVEGFDTDVLKAVLSATNRSNLADKLFETVPVFPVLGRDLIAIGFQPGRELGNVLKKLDAYWKESDFKMDQSELLAVAASLLPGDASCHLKI